MAEDTKAMPIMQAFYTRPPVQAKKPKSQDPRASGHGEKNPVETNVFV